MDVQLQILGDVRLAICPPEGPLLASAPDVNRFIEAAWGLEADWLALPVSRLGPDFLTLRTGLLGETTQKFVTHRTGLAVIGDINAPLAASGALRDYVRETERGGGVRFAPDLARLIAALS
ncbi:DUF4180 domain-containing protein [Brevundimonas sp.]|uniref:DUF4180 domain-containing protein n=1 Tax=Brevundimonas sp. TaxID=1871086 RepID=UPI001D40F73A|nr:DUF4180 domain-containing protein [Brevundimonas sp.]MBA4000686.1 DUF4180 domain-containing protein [Brevundimonas sp.]